MNAALRWKLVIGCLVVAALGLPDGAAVLAHDVRGPYCAYGAAASPAAGVPAPAWVAFDPRAQDAAQDTTVTSVDAPDGETWDDADGALDSWAGERN